MFSRAQVRWALQQVPGKQRLGVYRFLPFFFVLGGMMEWIMIKVRVGQETFCKWECSSLLFISRRQEEVWGIFLGDIPRLQTARSTQSAELLLPWSEGQVRFCSLDRRDPSWLSCKWDNKSTLKPFLCTEDRARDSTQDALLSSLLVSFGLRNRLAHCRRGWDLEDSWKRLFTGQSSGLFSPNPGRTWSAQLS